MPTSLITSITAALDFLNKRFSKEVRTVIWSLCDGASAGALYTGEKPKQIAGLILCNSLVITDEGLARSNLRHYYTKRLKEKEFWAKLVSFRIDMRHTVRFLIDSIKEAGFFSNKYFNKIELSEETLPHRVVDSLIKFKEPLRCILSIEPDIAAILYTSGSTGMPKGVVLSHQNIVSCANVVSEYLHINKEDRLLSILTFGFDYGLNQLTTSFLYCAQMVLLDYLFPKDILKAVEKYKITGLAAVATTWIQLLQASWEDMQLDSLCYITNSGGSIPVNYVSELRRRLPKTDIYSNSENLALRARSEFSGFAI